MTEYALYLESGPKKRTTMVHVPDLLGCIARGPTTEAALEAAPEAIRAYKHFLERHGEAVNPDETFTTRIAAHVMEGSWLGYGDPAPGFAPDFQPLSPGELEACLPRLDWLRADLLALIHDLPRTELTGKPEKGRSLQGILVHVAGSHAVYLRYLVGKVDGLSAAVKAVEEAPAEGLPLTLTHLWKISAARLEALTESERSRFVPHGQVTWTARRALRRMLEHAWEHLLEVAERLGKHPR
jgi:predicted RNase H-like HicB family nuclease/uncharacterized damage-inducible protein DinB